MNLEEKNKESRYNEYLDVTMKNVFKLIKNIPREIKKVKSEHITMIALAKEELANFLLVLGGYTSTKVIEQLKIEIPSENFLYEQNQRLNDVGEENLKDDLYL